MDELPDTTLICLRTCGAGGEASLLRSVLEASGIPCVIHGETGRGMLGGWAGYTEVRLMVPLHQAEEADRILRQSEARPAPPVDPVPPRLGAGYRDPYPPPVAEVRAGPVRVWRARHTCAAIAVVLAALAVALGATLGGR